MKSVRLRHIILFLLMAVFITPVRAGIHTVLGGNLQQRTNYYPFGAPYADPNMTVNASLQPYKYNGKELDRQNGL